MYCSASECNAGKRNHIAELIGALVCNPITAHIEKLDGNFLEGGMCEIIWFPLQKIVSNVMEEVLHLDTIPTAHKVSHCPMKQ